MAKNTGYRTYSYTIAASTPLGPFPVNGRMVRVLSASHSDFTVEIDGAAPATLPAGCGVILDGQIQRLRITNTSATTALTIVVAVGDGSIFDDRLTIDGGIDIAAAAAIPTTADVALIAGTKQVVAANTNRKAVSISNLAGNTTVRVGDSNAGAARGIEVAGGVTVTLNTTAAVHIYSAGVQNVGVLEFE